MSRPAKSSQSAPPQKGVFPLDHHGECKLAAKNYMACLEGNNRDYFKCKELSKAYFECRMDKNLMLKEDLNEMGFSKDTDLKPEERPDFADGGKEVKGFVSGATVKTRGFSTFVQKARDSASS